MNVTRNIARDRDKTKVPTGEKILQDFSRKKRLQLFRIMYSV